MIDIFTLSKNKRRIILIVSVIPATVLIFILVLISALHSAATSFATGIVDASEAIVHNCQLLWSYPKPPEQENFEDLWSDM